MEPEVKKSTHKVEVVKIQVEDIPGSDFVGKVKVYGYTAVTNKAQWEGTNYLAAYVPPDSLVEVSRPEFSFLATGKVNAEGRARIKGKKIRGILSAGLLVPAPAGSKEGDDVAEALGVIRYDPSVRTADGSLHIGGEADSGPSAYHVKYDLDAGQRYAQQLFVPGEPVVVTEKIHGENARYVYSGGRMHCGSRTEWKKEYADYSHVTVDYLMKQQPDKMTQEKAEAIVARYAAKGANKVRNKWWVVLDETPGLREFCEANPDTVVYGENYGSVQDLNYGHEKGHISFRAFDVLKDGRWLDFAEARELLAKYGVPQVPMIGADGEAYRDAGIAFHPFDYDKILSLAEGKTTLIAPQHKNIRHVREGVVVRPLKERTDERHGRVVLKFVGVGYLERSNDDFVMEE